MLAAMADSYAEVPYPSYCHPLTNIDGLCARGRLFGLPTASPRACRVLELGCASGGNLAPLAERWPGSTFVGIDRAASQIARGRELVDALGLTNIELHAADISTLEPGALGRFDYVLCHGVYSWVPAAVQARLLDLLPELLGPGGLALVSYNVYPGWQQREMVRKLMVFRSQTEASAGDRVRAARTVVELVCEAVAARREHIGAAAPDLYEQGLVREREVVRRVADSFLCHEHLERDNTPVLFHEFMAEVSARPLAYVSDAALDTMVTRDLPEATLAQLRALAADRVGFEQYLDFVRNREFRVSLLCRADARPRVDIDPAAVTRLRFAQHSRPLEPLEPGSLGPGRALSFPVHGSPDERTAIRVADPLVKAALVELCSRWPASLAFAELERGATRRLTELELELPEDPRAHLVGGLVECLVRNAIIARAVEPPLARTLARPRVSAFNLRAAVEGGWIAGLDHETFMLEPTLALLVPLLDGRDPRALLVALRELVAEGKLAPSREGKPLTDALELDAALEEFIATSLQTLARLPALIDPQAAPSTGATS